MARFLIKIFQFPVRFYIYVISPLLGPRCRFHPTCSAYALEALERHGVIRGFFLSIGRVLKCHPWSRCAWDDPVPKSFDWRTLMGYNPSIDRDVKNKRVG